jgi:hypothetical protein
MTIPPDTGTHLAALWLAVIALAAALVHASRRVARLEDFDELEMCARERLGRQVKRLSDKLRDPWDEEDEDDEE